jgi:hypothetical protein
MTIPPVVSVEWPNFWYRNADAVVAKRFGCAKNRLADFGVETND